MATGREHLWTLAKSTIGSLVCMAVELTLLHVLTSVSVPLPVCFASVQLVGTTITFTCNKYWAFDAANSGHLVAEGGKTVIVFAGSFTLNTGLPSLFAYALHLPPLVAYLSSQVLVYVAWNFPMNRFWVFRAQVV